MGLKDGERVLGAIENYLKVKFSLPKMDQVAVPDFAAGGTANKNEFKFCIGLEY